MQSLSTFIKSNRGTFFGIPGKRVHISLLKIHVRQNFRHLLFVRCNEWGKFQAQLKLLCGQQIVILLLSANCFEKIFLN